MWKKVGQLYDPRKYIRHPKLLSHAANPLPVHLKGDVYRIFYSGRDKANRSSVGAVDVDIVKREIVEDHYNPFIEHGPPGSFFADGISIGNCYSIGRKTYMLFMAWQTSGKEHWRGDIGRLLVNSDLGLELEDETPFIGSDAVDPISLSYPWVMAKPEGGFDMWYGSTRSWNAGNGEMLHVLQYATSEDGQEWARHGLAVPYELGLAQAFSRPTVIKEKNNLFEMWFSYRGGSGERYRIGYAYSVDGKNWKLDVAAAGISTSKVGWDSEMIEYPFVFIHKGKRYMLYNGNGYGETGFGLAVGDSNA